MGDTDPLQIRFDEFALAEADARLTRQGRPVSLPPKDDLGPLRRHNV